MKETWKPVVGFEGFYEVSDLGRVKSLNRTVPMKRLGSPAVRTMAGKILSSPLGSHGYPTLNLCRNGKPVSFPVHHLVVKAFIGPIDGYRLQVNHKNGIKTDNRLENLERCTARENSLHLYRIGLKKSHRSANVNHG
jgi:hypothetical protein